MRFTSDPNRATTRPAAPSWQAAPRQARRAAAPLHPASRGRVYPSASARQTRRRARRDRRAWLAWWIVVVALVVAAGLVFAGLFNMSGRLAGAGVALAAAALVLAWRELL